MRSTLKMAFLAGIFAVASTACYAQASLSTLPEVALTKADYQDLATAYQPLLDDDSLPIGTSREWSNEQTGNRGTVQLMKRFEVVYQGSKLTCRALRYHIEIKGNADPYNVSVNRCKVADGSWKIY